MNIRKGMIVKKVRYTFWTKNRMEELKRVAADPSKTYVWLAKKWTRDLLTRKLRPQKISAERIRQQAHRKHLVKVTWGTDLERYNATFRK